MKLRSIINAALAALIAITSASCVHQWPEPAETQVVLHLDVDTDIAQGPVLDMTPRSE